jgi:hypothetical protein
MFADRIPKHLSPGGWLVADKKVEKWRPHFMALSSLLCFEHGPTFLPDLPDGRSAFLVFGSSGFVSPGELANRLNERRADDSPPIRAIEDIPQSTRRALELGRTKHKAEIERPRVIFQTRRTE